MRYRTFSSHIGNPDGNQRPHNSIFVGGALKGSNYKDKRLKNTDASCWKPCIEAKVKQNTMSDLRVASNT